MDIFAHFLWTYALYFKNKKERLIAAFFGVLPDLLSFGPYFIYALFAGFNFGKPEAHNIPQPIFVGYDFMHSLIVFLIVFGIIYFITRKIYLPIFGWLIHILIDLPSHTKEFFATKFLWPLTNFSLDGVKWGNGYFMITNYSLLLITYVYLYVKFKNK